MNLRQGNMRVTTMEGLAWCPWPTLSRLLGLPNIADDGGRRDHEGSAIRYQLNHEVMTWGGE